MPRSKKTSRSQLTTKRLRKLLTYDPITGIWTHNIFPAKGLHKKEAGTILSDGYIGITLDKVRYLAHRLAYLFMKGRWPKYEIDHEDGVRSNNKWENLRAATDLDNSRNRKPHKNKRIPTKGVSPVSARGKKRKNPYAAYITVNGKQIYLGVHPTIEAASAAYRTAATKYFGKFARI